MPSPRRLPADRVDEQGQVLINAELGQALGVEPGELVVARVRDGRLTIQTLQSREEEVWPIFAGDNGSMVGSLIADRRVEFRREMIEAGVDEAEFEAIEQSQIEALRALAKRDSIYGAVAPCCPSAIGP